MPKSNDNLEPEAMKIIGGAAALPSFLAGFSVFLCVGIWRHNYKEQHRPPSRYSMPVNVAEQDASLRRNLLYCAAAHVLSVILLWLLTRRIYTFGMSRGAWQILLVGGYGAGLILGGVMTWLD